MNSTRVIAFLTVILSLLGLMAFFKMPREEDPRIKRRQALARVIWPGATPEKMDRLVVRPLEDELLKVEQIKKLLVETRLNVTLFQIELIDSVKDIDLAWREVERAIESSRKNLPADVSVPVLDFGILSIESVVLAITGSENLLQLLDSAEVLKDRLLKNPDVAEVRLFGHPQSEVRIDLDHQKMQRLGIPLSQVLQTVSRNNQAQHTGYFVDKGFRNVLEMDSDVATPAALEDLSFETQGFRRIRLKEFGKMDRAIMDPPQALFRWNGKSAIGLGIVGREGLNIEKFGEAIIQDLVALKALALPLQIETVAYQPRRTSERIQDLLRSLISGMLLIGILLLVLMGPAAAGIVTLMIPVISLIGLFVYFLTGGVLHQISIAAFIISIGQFIDNIIVVVDQAQTRLKAKEAPAEIVAQIRNGLKWPLAFATLTAVCAFLPMLSAEGATADFVTALPLVAIITLVCSYFVTLTAVPLLAVRFLGSARPRKSEAIFGFLERLFTKLALGPIWRVAFLLSLLMGVSIWSFLKMQKEFFPESDRNEFIFNFELSQSADISQTDKVLRKIEAELSSDQRVTSMAAFAGGDIPRFYYNLPNFQRAPHVGQVLITTQSKADNKPLGLGLEEKLSREFPEGKFTSLFLQQGPPINAKVELKIFADSQERRSLLTQKVEETLNKYPSLRAIRRDPDKGLIEHRAVTDEAELARLGLSRAELNMMLAFHSTGIVASQFRQAREIIPVRLRAQEGIEKSIGAISQQLAFRGRDQDFLIKDFVRFEKVDGIAIVRRNNGETFARVLADLKPNESFSSVMGGIEMDIKALDLKMGERIDFGGDAEGAGQANSAIFKVVPLAFSLLILFLLLEFQSYRKVLIAVLALPVTILGVFPGLWLGEAPFGFMSLLGLLALVGISVNNIILLLEALNETGSLELAIGSRIRAIFLTTILTLAGLLPLAMDESALWPPLAWTMISGLITGTIGTLIVVPVLYRIFFGLKKGEQAGAVPSAAAVVPVLIFLGLWIGPSLDEVQAGQEFSFSEILKKVENTSEEAIAVLEVEKAKEQNQSSFGRAFLPQLRLGGEYLQRGSALKNRSPFGDLEVEEKSRLDGKIEISQKIFDGGAMLAGRKAAQLNEKAVQFESESNRSEVRKQFVEMLVRLQQSERDLQFLVEVKKNLKGRGKDLESLIQRGRGSRTDRAKLEVLIEKTQSQQGQLQIRVESLRGFLAKALNLPSDFRIRSAEARKGGPRNEEKNSSSAMEKSLTLKAESLAEQADRFRWAGWPSAEVFGRVVKSTGRKLTEENWPEVGARIQWEIPLDGVRSSEAREVLLAKQQLQSRLDILKRQNEVEKIALTSQLQEKLRSLKELERLKEKTRLARSFEEERYFSGRGSLQELIEADQLQIEVLRDHDILQIAMIVDCVRLQILAGQEVRASCD